MAGKAMAKPKRVAIGISRVSLIKQADNYSLDAQNYKFRLLEQKFDCSIPEELMIEDAGYSGTDFNRPSIREALKRMSEGKANSVAFPYIDRFARNLEGGLALIRKFREAGADVLLGDLGWYTDERSCKTQVQLGLMFAEMVRDEIQEKSRAGVQTKVRDRNLAHGGKSPYGWRFVTAAELAAEAIRNGLEPPKGKPENVHRRVEEHIQNVILAGDLVLEGRSLAGICRQFRARGIHSPYAPTWNITGLGYILRNRCYYTGVWHYNKTENIAPKTIRAKGERHHTKTVHQPRPKDDWIPQILEGGPIVSKDKWDRIQEALERNSKMCVGRPAGERGRLSVLKGLIRCRLCERAVCAVTRMRPNGLKAWYQCSKRDGLNGPYTCDAKGKIRAEVLEEAVWRGVIKALTEDLETLVKRHLCELSETIDGAELGRMQQQEAKLKRQLAEAAERELLEDEPTLRQVYAKRMADIKAHLLLLRQRMTAVTIQVESIDVDFKTIAHEIRAGAKTKVATERREILVEWIHAIDYAFGEAEITLRIPLTSGRNRGVNRQQQVGNVGAGNQQHQADRRHQDEERRPVLHAHL